MDKLKAKLTQKIGPLPAWAWALLVVGAFFAYRKFAGGTSDNMTATNPETVDAGIIGTGVGADAGAGGTGNDYHEPVPIGDGIYDPNTHEVIAPPAPVNTPGAVVAPPPDDSGSPPPVTSPGTSQSHPDTSAVTGPPASGPVSNALIGASLGAAKRQAPKAPIAHIVPARLTSPAVGVNGGAGSKHGGLDE